jgi:riboflavin kinase/FMN adenylyltransferase
VVAIGNFDGVHRGHQAVIAAARVEADKRGGEVVALTFEPHPRAVLRPGEPLFRLTPAPMKRRVLRAAGADRVEVVPFDAAFSGLDAEAFFDTVLRGRVPAAHVVAGFDFHFGKGRGGTPARLVDLARAAGIGATIVPAFADEGGAAVGSTAIRAALAAGDVAAANAALGWAWAVEGEVLHGDKRGRTLGYPTANMAMEPGCALKHGVYAVRARVGGVWYAGAANYGRRIQFGDGPAWLETYIVDFSGDLYGKTIRIEFRAFLRPEERFASVGALVERMGADVAEARDLVTAALRQPRTPVQAKLED